MSNNRPSKDEYYLSIAEAVLACSTCLWRKYGAVIVKDDEIISTGYNGPPRGIRNCCDTGYCYSEYRKIPHGEMGEMYEYCRAFHAEFNAISASRQEMTGATLYLAGQDADGSPIAGIKPCLFCYRLIVNAGISAIITREADGVISRKEVSSEEQYQLFP